MQDLTAKLTVKTGNKSSDQRIALHLYYGEIGIPAVAAAARYLGNAGGPPAVTEYEDRGAPTA